jgi:hypothetical protein
MGNDEHKADKIQIRPGWLVVDVSAAHGGVHYDRTPLGAIEINGGEGQRSRYETVKTVDHVVYVHDIDAIVKRVDYILRKHCARAGYGWFADDEALAKVRAEVEALKEDAEALNRSARLAGCARRAYIDIVPAKIEIASEDAAREVCRTVRSVLAEIRDALRQGEVNQPLAKVLLKARNLDRLAVGIQADSIRYALEEVAPAKRTIREAVKQGKAPKDAGAALSLPGMDAAIDLFTPPQSDLSDDHVEEALRA